MNEYNKIFTITLKKLLFKYLIINQLKFNRL